jgi:hypothetical protein
MVIKNEILGFLLNMHSDVCETFWSAMQDKDTIPNSLPFNALTIEDDEKLYDVFRTLYDEITNELQLTLES